MPQVQNCDFPTFVTYFLVNGRSWEGFPEIIFNHSIVRVGYTQLYNLWCERGCNFFESRPPNIQKMSFSKICKDLQQKRYMTCKYIHITNTYYIYTLYILCIHIIQKYYIYISYIHIMNTYFINILYIHIIYTYHLYILYIHIINAYYIYVCVSNPLTNPPKKSRNIHTRTPENIPAVCWVTPTRWDSLWHILRCLETLKVEIFRKDTMKVGSIPSILSNIDHTNHLYN